MIEVDYSEFSRCDSCNSSFTNITIYDIWIDGDCRLSLCEECILDMMEQVKELKKEENKQ